MIYNDWDALAIKETAVQTRFVHLMWFRFACVTSKCEAIAINLQKNKNASKNLPKGGYVLINWDFKRFFVGKEFCDTNRVRVFQKRILWHEQRKGFRKCLRTERYDGGCSFPLTRIFSQSGQFADCPIYKLG